MKFLETDREKKSFGITTAIIALLLLLCIFFGLSYMDPPPESGIAINFGTTDAGMGAVQPTTPIQSAPQPTQSEPEPTPVEDQVVTQDVTDAPVINSEEPKKQPKEKTEKPKPKKDPKPSKSTQDALNSLLNGPKSDGEANSGQGDDLTPGDEGKINGELNGNYGSGGKGSGGTGDGNYQLGDRRALAKPQPQYTCNEQGKVVVQISVNKSGKVISATAGARGTTNSAKCLLDQAKAAAMKTTWQPDPNAPDKQIGRIVYNFTLTE